MTTPAHVPASAAVPTFGEGSGSADDVIVARVEGVDILLPVARSATTAIAYHSVDNGNTMPFAPVGERAAGGGLGEKLADIFAGGGGPTYYLMDDTGEDESSSTSGLDIGAVPGTRVVSPVTGKVASVKHYKILGRHADVEIQIKIADEPSLLLVITHVADVKVEIGDVVQRGDSALGVLRGFPTSLEQSLSRYTSDAGDHVQLVALRVTPNLGGL